MKKTILTTIILLISLSIIYFGFWFWQNYQFKTGFDSFVNKNLPKEDKERYKYETVRCNWSVFKPEFAYVYGTIDPDINFYRTPIFLTQERKNILDFYTGGTTVKNTTFTQLLAMVKEDCYQFQTGSKEIKEKGIIWSYSKAESKEEIEKRKREREERIKKEKEAWEKLSPEEKERIRKEAEEEAKKIEEFQKLSDEEKLKIIKKEMGEE